MKSQVRVLLCPLVRSKEPLHILAAGLAAGCFWSDRVTAAAILIPPHAAVQTVKDRAASSETWYRLDNAARVFAALASRRTTTVFRIAVVLREAVDQRMLQEALDSLMPRYPFYAVRLRAGLFWHYLSPVPGAPKVQTETRYPCRRMTRAEDGPWQFRVIVFDRRIALELSHVITDGAGGVEFLNAILKEYLERMGANESASKGEDTPPAAAMPDPEQAEDAYRRFYDPTIPLPRLGLRAIRLRGKSLPPDECRMVLGIVPVAPLRELSHKHSVALTELLASIMLAAIADVVGPKRGPIAVMTPVNLRGLFPSRTMRNFFLSVTASIDPRLGPYTFEEILHEVHHSVQGQVTAKSISRQIRRNVGAERNTFIRHVPLFLKVPVKRMLYTWRWGTRFTTVLSNLGRASLPEEIDKHIERFEVASNPSAAHGIACALIGHREHLYISFSSIVVGMGLERAFFTRLRRMGVPVRVETN